MTQAATNTPPADGQTPPPDNAKKDVQNPDNAKQPESAAGDKKPDGAAGANDGGDIYKPEGLPDHLLGKDNKETIDKLKTAVEGFRKNLSKAGVPETADGYTLELPEEIKSKVLRPGEDGKDPVLEKMKPILHKNNIPAAAFQELAKEFYGVVAEMAGSVDKNPDGTPLADFEFKELGGIEAAKPQIEGAEVWISGMVTNKKISEKTAAELKIMTGYSEGLAAINELRTAMGSPPIPKNLGSAKPDGITKEKLDARVQDERYWLKKDPEFIRETTELFQKFYAA